MNFRYLLCSSLLLAFLFSSCSHGDKANTIGATFDDAGSLENQTFTGNKIGPEGGNRPCAYLQKLDIATMLGVPVEQVSKGEDLARKTCSFTIIYDEAGDRPDYTTAGISFQQEITGDEEAWRDSWSAQKTISKSSEWVPNLGWAALWNPSAGQLRVKFDGYTLMVTAPKGPGKNADKSLKWAKEMVALGGFI